MAGTGDENPFTTNFNFFLGQEGTYESLNGGIPEFNVKNDYFKDRLNESRIIGRSENKSEMWVNILKLAFGTFYR